MKLTLICALFPLLVAPLASAADRTYSRYGDKIAEDALANIEHDDVTGVTISARPSAGSPIASFRAGVSTVHSSKSAIHEVLGSASGNEVGVLDLTFSSRSRLTSSQQHGIGEAIQREVSARIWNATSLFESFPVDTSVPYRTHAQQLVERTLRGHPHF